MRLVDYLSENARQWPDKVAVVCGDEQCTYAELDRRVDDCAAQLGGEPRQVVCLRAECSIDFLVRYLALHRRGCVAAPLERDMPEDTFRRVSAELGSHRCPEGTADVL